jgi:hypothetical protein
MRSLRTCDLDAMGPHFEATDFNTVQLQLLNNSMAMVKVKET